MSSSARELARNARDRAKHTMYTTKARLRQNSMPAALIGTGAAWMALRALIASRSGESGRSRSNWLDTLRSSPVPTTIAAASLGYLFVRGTGAHDDAGDHVERGGTIRRAAGVTRTAASRATGAVRGASRQVREKVGAVGTRVQGGMVSAKDRTSTQFERWMQENPLAVGAAALALGAAIGLTAPRTQTEDQVMGDARDRLVDMAQEAAQRASEKVQAVASETAEKVQTAAQEALGNQQQGSGQPQQGHPEQQQPPPPAAGSESGM